MGTREKKKKNKVYKENEPLMPCFLEQVACLVMLLQVQQQTVHI